MTKIREQQTGIDLWKSQNLAMYKAKLVLNVALPHYYNRYKFTRKVAVKHWIVIA